MEPKVLVCIHERPSGKPSCGGRGSLKLAEALEKALAEEPVPVACKRIACFGKCAEGPIVRIAPGGAFFRGVTEEMLGEILQAARDFRQSKTEPVAEENEGQEAPPPEG
ncbi:MAG: (2Fe-2S) ferredoxin domain-containing protein [Magnetococcales bacterium]|nr:(2Fe-2S) ferredoxin domain-containing protein [Magnetococcales bacterium]